MCIVLHVSTEALALQMGAKWVREMTAKDHRCDLIVVRAADTGRVLGWAVPRGLATEAA